MEYFCSREAHEIVLFSKEYIVKRGDEEGIWLLLMNSIAVKHQFGASFSWASIGQL